MSAARRGLCLALALTALAAPAQGSAATPAHGRAWELVTAHDTLGVQPLAVRGWSADGNRVAYASLGPMPGSVSGELIATSVAERRTDGWTSQPVGQPFTVTTAQVAGVLSLAAARDLSTWIWGSANPLLSGAPSAPMAGLYRRAADGTLTLLGAIFPGASFGAPSFLTMPTLPAASEDAGHVGLDSEEPLLPVDEGRIAGRAAYEADGSGLRLVGVDDEGLPVSSCGSVLGNGLSGGTAARHPISDDGSRIFFTAPDPSTAVCAEQTEVYLRSGETTTSISTSQCTRPDCAAPLDVDFAGASSDGSSAFLTTASQLTNDDVDSGVDLYRADGGGELTRLSAGPAAVTAGVQVPIRAADEGDRVYFVALGALVPGEGSAGSRNLYLRDGEETRFVATLAGGSNLSTAVASADGSALAFVTTAKLLPGDTDSRADVYRYDADRDELRQVSIGEHGQGNGLQAAALPGPGEFGSYPGHGHNPMTPDGRRVFVTTAEALVPEDTNEETDVYEWSDGSIGLLSSGGGGENAVAFAGAGDDGRSAFFVTREALLPADDDGGEADVYAARLGGGFSETQPSRPCEGEACQGPLPPAGAAPAVPASVTSAAEGPPAGRGAKRFTARVPRGSGRRLLRTGFGRVLVQVPAPGRVRLVGRAKLGSRRVLVVRRTAVAWRAGRIAVRYRLSRPARRFLRVRWRTLRLRLIVRHSRSPRPRVLVLELRSRR